jgi:hypothetical protein
MSIGFFGHHRRLTELEASASECQRKIAELEEAVRRLERQVVKQAHLMQVLHGLLIETRGMTEAEFLDKVRQVEAERTTAPPKTCRHCGKVLPKKDNRCIYCGEVRPVESVAELL